MKKALNVLKDLCLVITFNSYWKPRVEDAIAEIEEAMKPKTCAECIFWDTARPRSHPNYAECNNRKMRNMLNSIT